MICDTGDRGSECRILRTLHKTNCIIQLQETGAIIEIQVSQPLEVTKACLVCATHPVRARVKLGRMHNNVFYDCELTDVQWPGPQTFPPPARYQNKKRLTPGPETMKRKLEST